MQGTWHLEEASKVADLGIQSRIYLGVKWFHHHIQLASLAGTLPGPYDTTVYHHRGVDHSTSSINAFGVLGRYREVTLLVAKQIDIEAWQQANDGGLCG